MTLVNKFGQLYSLTFLEPLFSFIKNSFLTNGAILIFATKIKIFRGQHQNIEYTNNK